LPELLFLGLLLIVRTVYILGATEVFSGR